MAKSARARSTWAAGALGERLRRANSLRSSAVTGRRGSFWRRDMGHLGARGSPATIPNLTAIDPLGHVIRTEFRSRHYLRLHRVPRPGDGTSGSRADLTLLQTGSSS